METSDLSNPQAERGALDRVTLSGCRITGTRLRNCELQGLGGITSWAGAIMHPDDLLGLSYVLAGALGINVRETDR